MSSSCQVSCGDYSIFVGIMSYSLESLSDLGCLPSGSLPSCTRDNESDSKEEMQSFEPKHLCSSSQNAINPVEFAASQLQSGIHHVEFAASQLQSGIHHVEFAASQLQSGIDPEEYTASQLQSAHMPTASACDMDNSYSFGCSVAPPSDSSPSSSHFPPHERDSPGDIIYTLHVEVCQRPDSTLRGTRLKEMVLSMLRQRGTAFGEVLLLEFEDPVIKEHVHSVSITDIPQELKVGRTLDVLNIYSRFMI